MSASGALPLVRKNVWTLPAGDTTLAGYAKAVETMQGRAATDPTSWEYQAAIHGTYTKPSKPLWNGCKHGTWYFLPWHRMFLYYFERIVRAAVVDAGGAADWTLPFWDYEAGGQQATLPTAFRPGSGSNPLAIKRDPRINGGQALSTAMTSAAHAMACASFVGTSEFGGGITGVAQMAGHYGQLELQPHNVVHGAVGGIMTDPMTAGGDPIFWLHHANIDRLWNVWAGKQHPAPTDARWTGQKFTFFDEHGKQVSMTPPDVLDIERQLGYTYEVAPPAVASQPRQFALSSAGNFAQPPSLEPVGISTAPLTLTGAATSVEVSVDAQAASSLLKSREETEPTHVYLEMSDITGDRNPGTVYGVYLNLPDRASAAVAEAHYAATLSFFGIERSSNPVGDEPGHGLSMTRDITTLLSQLQAGHQWDGTHLVVTLRPLGLVPPDQPELAHQLPEEISDSEPPVVIGSVRILYG